MCRCTCRTMSMEQEKSVMTHGFIFFSIMQTITVVILCSISMAYLSSGNVSYFLPVDIVTLMIGIIFLSIIILIVGWSSALNNTACLWMLFHVFMYCLLLIEMLVSMLTSNVSSFVAAADKEWEKSEPSERFRIGLDLSCCGFWNSTDRNATVCQTGVKACSAVIRTIMTNLRNTASVALFVCFVFGMFIDFAGCGICFHPDTITFAEHEQEEALLVPAIVANASTYKNLN
ncbi:hypothetical protein TVAG_297060 [Trichomonas vaginalis G3]|uniref:Tetraspanin family protein n=1 Tax=Trichomonas vaginalis (strain ATCC PRA-98 / G3) TaxID=412133 RepID=A2DRA1_TRIV3|nr:hypothetical protein TVAGG3_0512620 [Trichomonas vaginalis G3]EAY17027.1 hypothetical protein TVAG_297060 [Trichomonas vaginalis G3]KAI5517890.1 hypothetical protein TVAGG3_0512620 [Trichomonas vaginalis G3]|eukprot:XP_001329250.1 hypothetical protein [Trichomonas vaginalis G3]